MTSNPSPFDSWSLSLLQRVNEACDRFRSAWNAGQRPRMEDFLAGTAEQERSAYLRELLALELELRSNSGETPKPEEYHSRFPGDMELISSVFADASARGAGVQSQQSEIGGAFAARIKRIRCPHCHSPIQLVDERPDEVLCPSCGSSFKLRDTRQTSTVAQMRQLGKFQLLERVGLGAMGAVWRARDTVLDKIVAEDPP